jgi:hypothetical protein
VGVWKKPSFGVGVFVLFFSFLSLFWGGVERREGTLMTTYIYIYIPDGICDYLFSRVRSTSYLAFACIQCMWVTCSPFWLTCANGQNEYMNGLPALVFSLSVSRIIPSHRSMALSLLALLDVYLEL